jgi:hypothetical protein
MVQFGVFGVSEEVHIWALLGKHGTDKAHLRYGNPSKGSDLGSRPPKSLDLTYFDQFETGLVRISGNGQI